MQIILALLLLSWTHSTQTLHGGLVVMSAMVGTGSILDYRVTCNTGPPCLPDPPVDQLGHHFSLVSRKVTSSETREHYRLKVPKNSGVEIITTATNEIGNAISYSIVMDGK